jgi:hypothetical protein
MQQSENQARLFDPFAWRYGALGKRPAQIPFTVLIVLNARMAHEGREIRSAPTDADAGILDSSFHICRRVVVQRHVSVSSTIPAHSAKVVVLILNCFVPSKEIAVDKNVVFNEIHESHGRFCKRLFV